MSDFHRWNPSMGVFDETVLRHEIARVWGEYGAHAEVFDALESEVARLREALAVAVKHGWIAGYNIGHGDGIGCGHPLSLRCNHWAGEQADDYADEFKTIADEVARAALKGTP